MCSSFLSIVPFRWTSTPFRLGYWHIGLFPALRSTNDDPLSRDVAAFGSACKSAPRRIKYTFLRCISSFFVLVQSGLNPNTDVLLLLYRSDYHLNCSKVWELMLERSSFQGILEQVNFTNNTSIRVPNSNYILRLDPAKLKFHSVNSPS